MAEPHRRKRRPTRDPQLNRSDQRIGDPQLRRSDQRIGDPQPSRSEQRIGDPQLSRSEQRNAARRAELEPLAPGERPPAIVLATIVATALGIANLVAYALGVKIQGKAQGPAVLLFPAVMALAAVGVWRLRYWAVLGFEALLALIVIVFALFLVRAANVEAVVLCVAVVGSGGWLFFKLVRVMARIQMPTREPPTDSRGARPSGGPDAGRNR